MPSFPEKAAELAARDFVKRFAVGKVLSGFVQALRYFPWTIIIGYEIEEREGEVIITQDLFVYEIMGEDANGKIVGTNAAKFIKDNIKGDVNIGQVDFDDQVKEQSQARWSGFYAGLDEAGVKYNKVANVSSHIQDDAVSKVSDMLTAHPAGMPTKGAL